MPRSKLLGRVQHLGTGFEATRRYASQEREEKVKRERESYIIRNLFC
jgi:hypothetical protein